MTEFPAGSPPADPPRPDGSPGASELAPHLTADALGSDPLHAFLAWMAEAEGEGEGEGQGDGARGSGMRYPNAVTLATVDDRGHPDARIVLLKGTDDRGFHFYTNYASAKGTQLAAHPHAALVFYWDAMGRQLRVRGPVERLGAEESDAYFQSRPRGSRIGAWTSEQSRPIASREALEARHHAMEARFGAGEGGDSEDARVPRPPHWGGFLLRPLEVEFWQEGAWRLHDRVLYRRSTPEARWEVERLQP